VSDRVAMLHQGKIVEVGTPDEMRRSENPYVKQFLEGSTEGRSSSADGRRRLPRMSGHA